MNKIRKIELLAAALVVMIGLVVMLDVPAMVSANRGTAASQANPAAAAANKQALKDQVDTPMGQPQNGRDPSTQQQTGLAQAATMQSGPGTRTDKPAAGITGTPVSNDHSNHATHADVYGDPRKTGINSAGCYIDYGTPGEQCLAAGLAGDDGQLSCQEVRTKFTNGIRVSGTDRLHLDHNGDGLACGPTE